MLFCRFTLVISKESIGGFFMKGQWRGALAFLANNVRTILIYIWLNAFLSKSADILTQWYFSDINKRKIVEFSPDIPTSNSISILSVPTFTPENGFKIFYIFKQQIWILIVISFITYSMFNFFSINKRLYFHSILDFFGLLVGQC